MGFAVVLGVIGCWTPSASAKSSSQSAQVLIIIPARPDLAARDAQAEAPAAATTEAAAPEPRSFIPARQRVITTRHIAGRTDVLHTEFEPL